MQSPRNNCLYRANVIHRQLKAEFVPDNTVGGPGDKLRPNRMGYQAMGMAIDLGMFGVRAR